MTAAPLHDSTNEAMLLLGFARECLSAPRGCPDSIDAPKAGGGVDTPGLSVLCEETFEGSAQRPRPNSAAGSSSSSRSGSPALIIPGRTYQCRKCLRDYASTDAVRKHARLNHPDWLREQGTGCPTLYCTPIDAPTGLADASFPAIADPSFSAIRPPPPAHNLTVVTTPQTEHVVAPAPSPEDSSLFTASESILALARLAPSSESSPAYGSLTHTPEDDAPLFDAPWALPPPARPKQGNKRPRSVRCGKCDGCERDDCGTCKNCVDKPKFGGLGQRKQGCVRKICRQPKAGP